MPGPGVTRQRINHSVNCEKRLCSWEDRQRSGRYALGLFLMMVRIFIGVGFFVLGYFVGKEIGRAESVRDQLDWAAEDDDLLSAKPDSVREAEPDVSAFDISDETTEEGRGES